MANRRGDQMKKITFVMITSIIILTIALLFPIESRAGKKDLDYIHEYIIDVQMLEDGSLKMNYQLVWEVLDSNSEGPDRKSVV